ncbi:hypothetical protein Psi02_64060 [Planotetraspora silvatica]|uniref:Uncharacterized protein n=1 Tax=Planotetraspora silvatica TaxID=234614 RepID=A0A8J3URJ5_9ACTN|nr:hypothetical protein Psi02_64060 [Planotetraspora silvatica]
MDLPDENFLYAFKAARLRRPARASVGQPAGHAALRPIPAGAAHALTPTKVMLASRAKHHTEGEGDDGPARRSPEGENPQGALPPAPPALLRDGPKWPG